MYFFPYTNEIIVYVEYFKEVTKKDPSKKQTKTWAPRTIK